MWLYHGLLLASIIVSSSSLTIGENGKSDFDVGMEYLNHFAGLTATNGESLPSQDVRFLVMKVQYVLDVPLTGELDADTVKEMRKPRCGNSDKHLLDSITVEDLKARAHKDELPGIGANNDPATANSRKRRYDTTGYQVPGGRGTWYVGRSSSNIDKQVAETIFEEAINKWTAVADLEMSKTLSSRATIKLSFEEGSHGDGESFDGRGGTLAHAFNVGRSRHSGKVHFDDAERWSTSSSPPGRWSSEVLLRHTSLHELGHSFGLDHTNDRDSIMYPTYSSLLSLGDTDVRTLQYLYGKKSGAPSDTTKAPVTSSPASELCNKRDLTVSAAFDLKGKDDLYLIIDNEVYKTNDDGGTAFGYPKSMNIFSRLPKDVEAAATWWSFEYFSRNTMSRRSRRLDHSIYFFKDNKYYRYDVDRFDELDDNTLKWTKGTNAEWEVNIPSGTKIDATVVLQNSDDRSDGYSYYFIIDNGARWVSWTFSGQVSSSQSAFASQADPISYTEMPHAGLKQALTDFNYYKTKEPGMRLSAMVPWTLDNIYTFTDKGTYIKTRTRSGSEWTSSYRDTGKWWFNCDGNRSARPTTNFSPPRSTA